MKRVLGGDRVWLLIPAFSIVPALLDAGQTLLKQLLDDDPGIDRGAVLFQGLEWLFLGALTPIAWYLARRFRFDRAGWKRALAAHTVGALLLCTGWATLGIVLGKLLNHWVAYGDLGPAYLNWLLTSVPWSVFMYFTVLGCVYAFTYFDEARARDAQAARLRAQLADARLGALRMQLHPHFLFNSLNTVTVLVREQNTRAAAHMLELLGDLLRTVLRPDRPHEIPLHDELQFVEQYLAIELMRFPDRLRLRWTIDDDARDALVPDMLLQPIIENAIRHGVARRTESSTVEIGAQVHEAVLRLTVRDEGSDGEVAAIQRAGLGLANTRERLQTLYGDAGTLELRQLPVGGTEAVIEIPLRRRKD